VNSDRAGLAQHVKTPTTVLFAIAQRYAHPFANAINITVHNFKIYF
jgi:hypothetical protein